MISIDFPHDFDAFPLTLSLLALLDAQAQADDCAPNDDEARDYVRRAAVSYVDASTDAAQQLDASPLYLSLACSPLAWEDVVYYLLRDQPGGCYPDEHTRTLLRAAAYNQGDRRIQIEAAR